MRPLAPRLQVIHDMVRPVGVAADIGCENGALGVALVLSGRAQRLIASDISLSSVEAAQATVRRLLSPRHASAVDVRLGDGLDALAPHEHVDTVTMSGIAVRRTGLEPQTSRQGPSQAATHTVGPRRGQVRPRAQRALRHTQRQLPPSRAAALRRRGAAQAGGAAVRAAQRGGHRN